MRGRLVGWLTRARAVALLDELAAEAAALLRDIAAGNELGDVSTLRDPDVVEDLQEQVGKS